MNPLLGAGILAFAVGCFWVALDAAYWYASQENIALYAQQSISSLVLRYYVAELLAICVVIVGVFLVYKGISSVAEGVQTDSIGAIIAEAVTSRKDFYVGAAAAVGYGAVYLLISSIVVFQPSVDFGAAYGVTSPTWAAAACCGSPGTVPALIVYLSPQAHLALQVLPLDLLFAVVVPLLVGLNAAVASHAIRNKDVRGNVGWMSSIGVVTGLLTGCPTCAGLFLAGAVGGLGATSLAVALAPYQMLFVLVSIPLLAASPLIIAFNARRAMWAACPVPGISPGPKPFSS
jgi:hypothetical protein